MAPDMLIAKLRPSPAATPPLIVLQPISHPELAPIHIHDSLFAIGRTEAPFDAYPPELIAELSRRHARIFCENGAVYLADLESKNGSTVNGVAVKKAITTLKRGDQIGFGGGLSFQLQIEEGAQMPRRAARLASLVLRPEHREHGLQPIVVTEFPFLISKADDSFSRYQQVCPQQQLNYLSRRHAHIFLKDGQPWVEDLGSTNGSFVNDQRLDEHAVALHEGDLLGFGGHHFVYRIEAQWAATAPDPTLTRVSLPVTPIAQAVEDSDKTTFVAAADSFLDIFCVDQAAAADETPEADAPAPEAAPAAPRGKKAEFGAQLLAALGGKSAASLRRASLWGAAGLLLAALLAWALYQTGAAEREAQSLFSEGAYAQAALAADQGLARDPDNGSLRSLGTAALLKASLPAWMAQLKAQRFERAAAVLTAMRQQGRHNPDLGPLLGELEWIGGLEAFVAARGGALAPIRSADDAARIAQILKQWEDEKEGHQRAFMTIAAYVPQYRDAYADALSDVRKLALTGGGRERNEPATP
ncbi:MAG: FHA domain-containing protein [Massilia sp.]